MVTLTCDFRRESFHLLQIEMHLVVCGFRAQARVRADTIVLDFPSGNKTFQALKGLRKPLKEDIVRVERTLGFVWILQEQKIHALKVHSFKALLQLSLDKLWVHTVS